MIVKTVNHLVFLFAISKSGIMSQKESVSDGIIQELVKCGHRPLLAMIKGFHLGVISLTDSAHDFLIRTDEEIIGAHTGSVFIY